MLPIAGTGLSLVFGTGTGGVTLKFADEVGVASKKRACSLTVLPKIAMCPEQPH